MRFRAGERVQVKAESGWAAGATGTVGYYPDVDGLVAGEVVDDTTLVVPTLQGPLDQTWIIFDEPQFDSDGDGPYAEATIDCDALTSLR